MDAIAAANPSLLAQGRAMRDALLADLAQLPGVELACAASALAPLPARIEGVAAVAARPDESPPQFLGRLAPGFDRVWAIAPECGGLLADLAAVAGERRWIGCGEAAIRLAQSKSATRSRLAAHRLPVPAGWQPGAPEPAARSAWVVKPDDGAGTEDTHLHADFAAARADLLARLAAGRPSTMERWVEGRPMSVSLLCLPGRTELLAINHQRIDARPGALAAYLGVEVRAEPVAGPRGHMLAGLARRLVAALPGLAGYVGVDLVWHPRRGPVVIEVNPRLTCAYVGLSSALGRNVAGEILRGLSEAPRDRSPAPAQPVRRTAASRSALTPGRDADTVAPRRTHAVAR